MKIFQNVLTFWAFMILEWSTGPPMIFCIPGTELIVWGHRALLKVLHVQVGILNSTQSNGSK